MLLASCGETEQTPLSQLVAERDSLKVKHAEIGTRLSELDQQIALLDTSVKERRMLVSALLLEPKVFEHYFEVQGVVQADKSVTVTSEFGGTVQQILVKEGQRVSKGEVLVKFNTDVIDAQISQVESQRGLSEEIYNRQKRLWDQKVGSEIQFLQAKSNFESMDQTLTSLKEQRNKVIVKAPNSGMVDEIFPNEGEMNPPGFPVVRLVNSDNAYIVADISEKYVRDIKKGNNALVNFSLIDGEWQKAQVNKVGEFINPDNRTFKVNIALDKSTEPLKPNMLSVVRILDFNQDSAVVVPGKAIMQDAQGKNYVFIASDEMTAEKTTIEIGLSYRGQVHVLSGLKKDDQVIIEGARSLQDGEKIEIKN